MSEKAILIIAAVIFTAWTIDDYSGFRVMTAGEELSGSRLAVFYFIIFSFWVGAMTILDYVCDALVFTAKAIWKKVA